MQALPNLGRAGDALEGQGTNLVLGEMKTDSTGRKDAESYMTDCHGRGWGPPWLCGVRTQVCNQAGRLRNHRVFLQIMQRQVR